ncbi:D-arabinose 5-phosphate isomerase [Salmonella enterica]|uniref:D-arabinose 5-phosphate isomerase n=1 Tax=Salmonella sp. NCTC 6947 TaxID=2583581 RepID=A0A509BDT8_9ENTR|nr:D-arabinose 5-phosphate isomerase [Salmonella enterica]
MSHLALQPGFDFQQAGKEVLEIEREGLAELDQYINQHFTLACEKMFNCTGKVVVMGMGKSGHIGRKMAATFASTGTSSFFVHPGEAAHGDLGDGYAAGCGYRYLQLRRIQRDRGANTGA